MSRKRAAPPRGRAHRAAEKALDYHAVCLIGYERPVPRHFGDNHGAWPVRVVATKKPRDAAKRSDLEQPLHELVVHDFVQLESEEHARMLKAALDDLLLGTSRENRALRHGWRNIEADPQIVWPVLLKEAVERLTSTANAMRRATSFAVISPQQAETNVGRKKRGRG